MRAGMLEFSCPYCYTRLTAPESKTNSTIQCRCGFEVVVPTRASLEGIVTPRETVQKRWTLTILICGIVIGVVAAVFLFDAFKSAR